MSGMARALGLDPKTVRRWLCEGGPPLWRKPRRPTVTASKPASVFEWFGHLAVPGLFDGRHRFDLVLIPSGTLLVHSESFGGLLVRPLHRSLDGSTRAGFQAMDEALRRRVRESHPAS